MINEIFGMYKSSRFETSAGFNFVELLIVVAISSVLALLSANMFATQNLQFARLVQKGEIADLSQRIRTNNTNPLFCNANFVSTAEITLVDGAIPATYSHSLSNLKETPTSSPFASASALLPSTATNLLISTIELKNFSLVGGTTDLYNTDLVIGFQSDKGPMAPLKIAQKLKVTISGSNATIIACNNSDDRSQILSGWPDAIRCNYIGSGTPLPAIFYIGWQRGSGEITYGLPNADGSGGGGLNFNPTTKEFTSMAGSTGGCSLWDCCLSIAELDAAGKTIYLGN